MVLPLGVFSRFLPTECRGTVVRPSSVLILTFSLPPDGGLPQRPDPPACPMPIETPESSFQFLGSPHLCVDTPNIVKWTTGRQFRLMEQRQNFVEILGAVYSADSFGSETRQLGNLGKLRENLMKSGRVQSKKIISDLVWPQGGGSPDMEDVEGLVGSEPPRVAFISTCVILIGLTHFLFPAFKCCSLLVNLSTLFLAGIGL